MLQHPYREPPPAPAKKPGRYHGRVLVYTSFGGIEEYYVGSSRSLVWMVVRTKLKAMRVDYFVVPRIEGIGIEWQVGFFEIGKEPACSKKGAS